MIHTLGKNRDGFKPPTVYGDYYTDGAIIVSLSALAKRLPLPTRRALEAGTVATATSDYAQTFLHRASVAIVDAVVLSDTVAIDRRYSGRNNAKAYGISGGGDVSHVYDHYHEPLTEAGLHPVLSANVHCGPFPVVVYIDNAGTAKAVIAPINLP